MGDFDKRAGTATSYGIEYETQMMVYLAVAACNENLKDFWIVNNVDGVGAWDDIILYTETIDGHKQLKFMQLKHKESLKNKRFAIEGLHIFDVYFKDFQMVENLINSDINKTKYLATKALLDSTGVPFREIEFIYFTNKLLKEDLNLIALDIKTFVNTNSNAEIYEVSVNITDNDDMKLFLRQFRIFANQSGVSNNSLQNDIIRELESFIKNAEFTNYSHVAQKLKLHIENEFIKSGRKLTLADTQEAISTCILSTFKHKKTAISNCQSMTAERWAIFEKLVNPYQLVVLCNEYTSFGNFFSPNNSHDFITCAESYYNLVINCLKIAKNQNAIWATNSFDSTIKTDFTTFNSAKDLSQESLALLAQISLTIQGRTTTFQKLLQANPNIIDTLTVDDILNLLADKLQIGEQICTIPEYYVSRSMPRLFVNKSIIFKYPKSYFLLILEDDQRHTKIKANSFQLKQTKLSDIRLVEKIKNKTRKESTQTEFNFKYVKNDTLDEEILNIESEFKTVHIFKYHKYKLDFVLEWISSNANIHELDQFIETEQFNVEVIQNNGNELYLNRSINRLLIVANAGMGKTYLTKYIVNNYPVESWVVLITLNEINFEAIHSFQSYLENYTEKLSPKTKQVFEMYLENQSIVVLFDGFDEVAPYHEEAALDLISGAFEQKFKIIVTSREGTKVALENNLNVLAHTLFPFTTKDKEQFIERFYLNNIRKSLKSIGIDNIENKIQNFTNKLLQKCSLSQWDDDFTDVPLQCRLLAEGFVQECQNYCRTSDEENIPKSLNLLTLYENFIDRKFNIYIEEKVQMDAKNPLINKIVQSLKDEFSNKHMMAAVQIIFPLVGVKISDKFMEEIRNGIEKHGIITAIDANNNPIFIHRTFAEYFAAKWLVQIKEQNEETENNALKNFLKKGLKLIGYKNSKRIVYLRFLLEPQFNIVRDLFDKMLCKNCDLHNAVLNADVKKIEEILEKNGGRDEGKCGRTSLHLIAARGAQHDQVDEKIKRTEEERYLKVLSVLLEKKVWNDKVDEVLGWTALQYANERNAFGIIDTILQYEATELYNLEKDFIKKWKKSKILQMCAEYDYVRLLETVKEHNKINWNDLTLKLYKNYNDKETLLHVAAFHGSVKIIDLLLNYQLDVNIVDNQGNTALHHFCRNGNLPAVKKSVGKGGNIFLANNNGNSPIDEAIECENKELIEYVTSYDVLKISLVTNAKTDRYGSFKAMGNNLPTLERLILEEKKVNIIDGNGDTTLHYFCRNGHLSAVKSLVANGGNLFLSNNQKESPMDLAIESKNRELIEYLTNYDVLKIGFGNDINVALSENYYDYTALHYAVMASNLSTIERLISEGADINIPDKYQRTVLHLVFYLQEEDFNTIVMRRLIESGANIDAKDVVEKTPLHYAALLGNKRGVELLLELGANPNILDDEQRTALSVARETIRDEVFLLIFERTEVINERDVLHKSVLTNGNDLEVRRATFVGFPQELKKMVESLCQAGFYYYGHEDKVRCFKCGIGLQRLKFPSDPWIGHAIHKPECEFLIREKGHEFIYFVQQRLVRLNLNEKRITEVNLLIDSATKSRETSGKAPNAQNIEGQTALHSAALLGNTEMVKTLLGLGADPNNLDNEQRTPLSVARININNETFLALWDNTQIKNERDIRFYIRIGGTDVDTNLILRTFVGFPQELSGLVNLMAESGLYYVGINDEVKCFRCGAWINRWCPWDDPWDRHAIVKPNCTFFIEQ